MRAPGNDVRAPGGLRLRKSPTQSRLAVPRAWRSAEVAILAVSHLLGQEAGLAQPLLGAHRSQTLFQLGPQAPLGAAHGHRRRHLSGAALFVPASGSWAPRPQHASRLGPGSPRPGGGSKVGGFRGKGPAEGVGFGPGEDREDGPRSAGDPRRGGPREGGRVGGGGLLSRLRARCGPGEGASPPPRAGSE